MRHTKTPARFAGAVFSAVLAFALAAVVGLWPAADAQAATGKARNVGSSRSDGFMSDGRFVRVDVVRARFAAGPAPAVLILHGAHGLGDGSLFYPQAEALAEAGIHAFVIHYFDGIGMSAPVPARKAKNGKAVATKSRSGSAASPQLHWARDRVIGDALDFISDRRDVDAARIGVFGLSLGGFHALGIGARDQRVQAVVNVVGAMPSLVARNGVHRMPPTLILHGDKDRVVALRKAHELAALLKQLGTPHELHIYKGQGHSFKGDARTDSFRRTVAFFSEQLSRPRTDARDLASADAPKDVSRDAPRLSSALPEDSTPVARVTETDILADYPQEFPDYY